MATPSTVPAATAVRSMTPYTTVARSRPRHPQTSARTAPKPAAGSRRPGGVNRRLTGAPRRTVTRSTPGVAAASSSTPGGDQLALACTDRIREPDQLVAAATIVRDRLARATRRLGSRCVRRASAAHAGPPTPNRATCTSSTESSTPPACRTRTSARPGARPQPASTVVPRARAGSSSARSALIAASWSATDANGMPRSTAACASTASARRGHRRRDRVDRPAGTSRRRRAPTLRHRRAAPRPRTARCLPCARRRRPGRRPRVSSNWRAVRTPVSPRPTTRTEVTGSRVPAAPANRRSFAARGPFPAPGPRHSRPPRSRRRAGRAGRPSSDAGVYRPTPDGEERVAAMARRRPAVDDRLLETARPAEVLGDDVAVLARRTRTSHPRIALVGKHRFEKVQTNGPPGRSTRATSRNTSIGCDEVVDRHAAHHRVERRVGERQLGLRVEVVDDARRRLRVRGQLARGSCRAP